MIIGWSDCEERVTLSRVEESPALASGRGGPVKGKCSQDSVYCIVYVISVNTMFVSRHGGDCNG